MAGGQAVLIDRAIRELRDFWGHGGEFRTNLRGFQTNVLKNLPMSVAGCTFCFRTDVRRVSPLSTVVLEIRLEIAGENDDDRYQSVPHK